NCVVADLVHKIGAPIPLQTGRIKRVEHALQRRMRDRTYKIERWFLESAYGLERFFRFFVRSSVRPDDAAHFFHVQMFGERWSWRNGEQGEKATQIIGRGRDEIAVPFHHVSRFA